MRAIERHTGIMSAEKLQAKSSGYWQVRHAVDSDAVSTFVSVKSNRGSAKKFQAFREGLFDGLSVTGMVVIGEPVKAPVMRVKRRKTPKKN